MWESKRVCLNNKRAVRRCLPIYGRESLYANGLLARHDIPHTKAVEVRPGGDRPTSVVPSIPPDVIASQLLRLVDELTHGPAKDVVDCECHSSWLLDLVPDGRGRWDFDAIAYVPRCLGPDFKCDGRTSTVSTMEVTSSSATRCGYESGYLTAGLNSQFNGAGQSAEARLRIWHFR